MHRNLFPVLPALLLTVILAISCNKGDNEIEPGIIIQPPSGLSENELIINWTSNISDHFKLTVSPNNDLTDPILDEISIPSGTNSYRVTGLQGMTEYFCRLSLYYNGKLATKADFSVTTGYHIEKKFFSSGEGITLCAEIMYLSNLVSVESFGFLLFHEMGADKKRWQRFDIIDSLVCKGHICLCLDFRGHGESTPVEDLASLTENNYALPEDINAAISYLVQNYNLQPGRFILAGGSLGAISATGGSSFTGVAGGVSLSAVYDPLLRVFGTDVTPRGMLYIAGSEDIMPSLGIDCPADVSRLYDITGEPRGKYILGNSSAHGTDLLSDSAISEMVLQWMTGLTR